MRIYILVPLLLIMGCNNNNFIKLIPQNDEMKSLLEVYAKEFNEQIGCEALSLDSDEIQLGPERILQRRKIKVLQDSEKVLKEGGNKALGYFDPWTNEIVILDTVKLGWNKFNFAFFHELGHAMGLEHEAETIMNEIQFVLSSEDILHSLIQLLNKHKRNQCWEIENNGND